MELAAYRVVQETLTNAIKHATGQPTSVLLRHGEEHLEIEGPPRDPPSRHTGYVTILSAPPDLTVVGEAADGREAVELARRSRPDVIVMDIRMPVLDGITSTRTSTRHSVPAPADSCSRTHPGPTGRGNPHHRQTRVPAGPRRHSRSDRPLRGTAAILTKLDLRDRVRAVVLAYRTGLVSSTD